MATLNRKRIILGGIVAGFVIVIAEIATEPIIGSLRSEWLAELGLAVPSEAAMAPLLVMPFLIGVVMVWLYANLRSRYGTGPKTAILAGLTVWFLECFSPSVAMLATGLIPSRLFFVLAPYVLVVSPLAALAGAKLYRDPDTSATTQSAGATIATG